MLRYYRSIFLSISTHFSHISASIPSSIHRYDEQATVLFQGDLGRYRVDLVLIVHHADERGLKRKARRLLGGALARGGHPTLGPAGQAYIEIVYPEYAGLPW
jgi:hypothetical protein